MSISALIMESQTSVDEVPARAILCGLFKTSTEMDFSMDDLRSNICTRPQLPILERLREEIATCAMKSTPANAAERFGLREDFILDVVQEYVTTEVRSGKFPYNTYEKFTQTYGQPINPKIFAETPCQMGDPTRWERVPNAVRRPEAPAPAISDERQFHKTYTTVEKIKAVRAYTRADNPRAYARDLGIPAINIIRWKEKMTTVLFSDQHAKNLYIERLVVQARDKFLRDIDNALFKWFSRMDGRVPDPDETIITKAKSIANIDGMEPKVSKLWLRCFKSYYHIGQPTPAAQPA